MPGRRTKHSMKTRKLMSLKAQGKNNPFYGRKHSAKTRKLFSRLVKGKRNPMFGRRHTAEARRKIRLARLRTVRERG